MSISSKQSKTSYIPATDDDLTEMLGVIGADNVDELFNKQIPESARFDAELNLPKGLSEQEVTTLLEKMAAENRSLKELVCFLGAGIYDHYVPAVVESVISKPEFVTTYTPYQAEASQGLLQSIYEYQSLVCDLTGMEVSNASLYDGGTAVSEAALMASSVTGRTKVLVSQAVHPNYRAVLRTYLFGRGIEITETNYKNGVTDVEAIKDKLDEQTACVIVQYPNFFGCIESLADIADAAHAVGALLVVSADPIALGLIKPPGRFGADIVVGEAQALGLPPSFGGPLLGIFACRKEHVWKMPGRLVGATVDADGRRAYTLTLQAREQHIRREKATSNICTNQALAALAATVYLSAMGADGLRHTAELCFHKAHYAQSQLINKTECEAPWSTPFFKEFVVRLSKSAAETNEKLLRRGILGGLDLGRYYPELEGHMLLCVTEKRTREEIDRLLEAFAEL